LEHQHLSKFAVPEGAEPTGIAPHADPSRVEMARFFEQCRGRSLTRVIVSMPWGGTVESGAALFLSADGEDAARESVPRGKSKRSSRPLPLPYSKKDRSTHRTVIGYVTSGIYSLIRGQGHGIGFVLTEAIADAVSPANQQRNNRK